jgi:universal stress protein A
MGPNSEQQMIEEQAIQEPGMGLFKAAGKLADADYQAFIPRLESLINEYGKISLLLELEDFHGWQPTAASDDFKIGLTHADDFERIAIVGDRDWARWIARLAGPFTHAEVRYFDHEDRDAAWDWLKQNALSAALGRAISTTRYHHVLIAIDFSTRSAQVLERGLVVASQNGAKVTVFHVVDEPYFEHPFEDAVLPPISEYTVHRVELARTRLLHLAKAMGTDDLERVAPEGRDTPECGAAWHRPDRHRVPWSWWFEHRDRFHLRQRAASGLVRHPGGPGRLRSGGTGDRRYRPARMFRAHGVCGDALAASDPTAACRVSRRKQFRQAARLRIRSVTVCVRHACHGNHRMTRHTREAL